MIKEKTITQIDAAMKFRWHIDEETGCWICESGHTDKQGYRFTRIAGIRTRVHRLAYWVFNNKSPKGKVIRHICDNRACINPLHLVAGTKRDNTQDMIQRGRASDWKDRRMLAVDRRRKLTAKEIHKIRRRRESSYKLSEIYGVSATHIRRIRNGSRCTGLRSEHAITKVLRYCRNILSLSYRKRYCRKIERKSG